MISDVDLFVNKYVSVPKDMGGLNCAAFVAGIVKGALDNAGFSARWVPSVPCSQKERTQPRRLRFRLETHGLGHGRRRQQQQQQAVCRAR